MSALQSARLYRVRHAFNALHVSRNIDFYPILRKVAITCRLYPRSARGGGRGGGGGAKNPSRPTTVGLCSVDCRSPK